MNRAESIYLLTRRKGEKGEAQPTKEREFIKLDMGSWMIPAPDHHDVSQDSCFTKSDVGCMAVFDGLGGCPRGDLASKAASEALFRVCERSNGSPRTKHMEQVFASPVGAKLTQAETEVAMHQLFQELDAAVFNTRSLAEVIEDSKEQFIRLYGHVYSSDHPRDQELFAALNRPATTATVLKIWTDEQGQCWGTVGHMGDGRLYVQHEGVLRQVTKDHSYKELLTDLGLLHPNQPYPLRLPLSDITDLLARPNLSDAERMHLENLTTRAKKGRSMIHFFDIENTVLQSLGSRHDNGKYFQVYDPSIHTFRLPPKSKVLLATDGVIRNLSSKQINEDLLRYADQSAKQQASQICQSAVRRFYDLGGHPDDVTCAITETPA